MGKGDAVSHPREEQAQGLRDKSERDAFKEQKVQVSGLEPRGKRGECPKIKGRSWGP